MQTAREASAVQSLEEVNSDNVKPSSLLAYREAPVLAGGAGG